MNLLSIIKIAGMAELVDAPDSKSGSGNRVRVRFSLPAPLKAVNYHEILCRMQCNNNKKNPQR